MKKVITIAITICLLLGSIPAFAQYDGEILFRDIPWDTPALEYEKQIYQGIGWNYTDSMLRDNNASIGMAGWRKYGEKLKDIPAKTLMAMGSAYVAGCRIIRISGVAFPLVENGIVGNRMNDYRFAEVSYHFVFDLSDPDALGYDDLLAKLVGLYGDYTECPEQDDKAFATTPIKWTGANGTSLTLYHSAQSETSQYDSCTLAYGYDDISGWLEMISNPKSTIDTGSTDGL